MPTPLLPRTALNLNFATAHASGDVFRTGPERISAQPKLVAAGDGRAEPIEAVLQRRRSPDVATYVAHGAAVLRAADDVGGEFGVVRCKIGCVGAGVIFVFGMS